MSLSIYVLRATHSRRSEPLKLVGYKSHATNTHRDCAVRIPLDSHLSVRYYPDRLISQLV